MSEEAEAGGPMLHLPQGIQHKAQQRMVVDCRSFGGHHKQSQIPPYEYPSLEGNDPSVPHSHSPYQGGPEGLGPQMKRCHWYSAINSPLTAETSSRHHLDSPHPHRRAPLAALENMAAPLLFRSMSFHGLQRLAWNSAPALLTLLFR